VVRCSPKFVTKQSKNRLTLSESVQAMAESALHFDRDFSCSGRLSPSWWSGDFCSAVGSVMRRRRISRPLMVGSTMSALCSVDSKASTFMDDKG
jgi:hypothetical protein